MASYAILLLVRALGSVDTNADAVYVVHFLAAYHSALCVAIAAAGGIPSLVALLESPSLNVQKRAVGVLINLSANDENMVTIVALLESPSVRVQEFAARALCVQPERECREQSNDRVSRGIPPLIALLASPSAGCNRRRLLACCSS